MSDPSVLTAIVERLLFGLVNAQLYGPGSARVVAATDDAAARVSAWCAERGTSSVLVGAVDDQVVVEGRPLLGASLFAKRLVQRIRERGAGGVEIQADAPAASLRALLEVLARRGGAADHVAANEELHAKGAAGVRLVPPFTAAGASVDRAPWSEELGGIQGGGAGGHSEMDLGVGAGVGCGDDLSLGGGPLGGCAHEHGGGRGEGHGPGDGRDGDPGGEGGPGGGFTLDLPMPRLVQEAGRLVALHQTTVDQLQELTISACQGKEIAVGEVGDTVERILAGLEHDAGYLHGLAQYPEHDFFTFGHSIRVALLALDVARQSTPDRAFLARIGTAALLHDVGKALVSWEVLHKRGSLTREERFEMQKHPVLGAGILLALKDSDPLAVAAAYGHHRQSNDRGYPASCSELEQGVVTRLVKICDVFEALTAARPYKAPMTPVKAYRTMTQMTGTFDADLLGHFIRTIGIHPGGTWVRLDDGRSARVVRQTDDLHRPVVEPATLPDGTPIPPGERRPYDLTAPEPGGPSRPRCSKPPSDRREAPPAPADLSSGSPGPPSRDGSGMRLRPPARATYRRGMVPPRPPRSRLRPPPCVALALLAAWAWAAARPAAADFDAAKKHFQDGLASTDWKVRRAGYLALLDYDGGPAAQAILSALGAETNPAVEAAAVDGLARLHSKEATAELLASLSKGKSKERLLAAVALAKHVTPEADAALIAALGGKDALLAAQAALALGTPGRAGAGPALLAALAHPAPQVRIAAMRSLAATAEKAAGPAIVARLAQETGRVRGEAIRALETLATRRLGDAPRKWAAWAKGEDPDAVDEKPALPPSFFGAPVTGTRVVFCLDRSLLMKDAHPWVGQEGRERLEALCTPPDGERIPWRQLKTKLQLAVAQILHAADGLPAGAKLEVIPFAKEVGGAFDRKLVPANGANRKALAATLWALEVDDGINLFDALATALDLGGPTDEKAWKAGPDEIFLVTNNGPTAGLVADVDAVAPAIALRARLRLVPITVVGIGNHPYGLAETLAKRTGGAYLNLSK